MRRLVTIPSNARLAPVTYRLGSYRREPGKALTVNEGPNPWVVAENHTHLRRKADELVSVYRIFSRSS